MSGQLYVVLEMVKVVTDQLGDDTILLRHLLLHLNHLRLGRLTGGKGSITQWVHVEYMEGSETICPTFTQWVRGGYFSKVPTKVPTG